MAYKYPHLFWDFDGCLFDTYPAMAEALRLTLLEELGVEEAHEEIYKRMKVTIRDTLAYYDERYGLSDAFLARYKARRKELEAMAGPYPGIPELLGELERLGVTHYLYTHRGLSAEKMLREHGLADLFRHKITSADGFPMKPDPTALVTIASLYGIDPADAMMIGDREIDALSGKQADMAACLMADVDVRDSVADRVVTDVSALRQYLIVELVNGNEVTR